MSLYVTRDWLQEYFGVKRTTLYYWTVADDIRTEQAQQGSIVRGRFKTAKGKKVACLNWDDIQEAAKKDTGRWRRR